MATPHINAEMGDFADVVLMPGDPLRAKYIAETFLEDAREVNNVRGMLGFTGTYKGRKISVMGHGMGIPSCSIYTKELITDFGVKKIIRVGSCGAVLPHVKLRDVVIGMGACTDSKVNRIRFKDHDFAAIADFDMVRNAVDAAKALGIDARVGNLFSADLFYSPDGEMFDVMEKYGILGVEMEAAGRRDRRRTDRFRPPRSAAARPGRDDRQRRQPDLDGRASHRQQWQCKRRATGYCGPGN